MRVLMISSNTAVSPYPLYPLGCSMVAAALIRAGHEVRQFDYLKHQSSLQDLAEEVLRFDPGLVGVSIRNIDNVNSLNEQRYIEGVTEMVTGIKRVSDSKVVLGGPGFSLIPGPILEETGADYGIIGEGEALMADFADQAERGCFPEQRLLGPETRLSGLEIPSAEYDVELLNYYKRNGNIASVQTKRGCSHHCVYCSYPLLEGQAIRRRDPVSVVDDIELLQTKHEVKTVFITDSVFNDDEGAYMDVLYEMERRNVFVPWTAFFKPTGLNDEVVAQMKKTGLVSVELGADAACDRTLKRMGKNFTFKEIEACHDLFAKHGIAAAHFYMFGGPGETRETVLEGIENIKRLEGAVVFIYMGIRILPNTALAELAVAEKIISPENGLLEPVYYFSPGLDRDWLEKTLTQAFAGIKHCIFPPDALDEKLRILHKMGYAGPMWEYLRSPKKAAQSGGRS